ncbi:MAG: peroxidase-related enzyme [Ginsengibacter sp.]
MAHIQLNNDMPGIRGLFNFNPETAKPMSELAEILLVRENSLTRGEREMIASSVSYWNDCHFCHSSHGASAANLLQQPVSFLTEIKQGFPNIEVSSKVRALLNIAKHVQKGGKNVTEEDISSAREAGAANKEIHDTVLIAAAFCMYNRYVDGMATWAPKEDADFMPMGKMLAEQGYQSTTP